MKQFIALLLCCLLLAGCAAAPADTTAAPETTAATQPSAPAPTTEAPVTVPQPMDLVGTWNFSYSEIEGDTNTTGTSTVVISGESPETLTITYQDPSFPEENFSGKALKLDARELYPGCGNDAWVMDVDHVGAIGNTTYDLTLLADGTLAFCFNFTVDGMPMASYQFFTRAD